MNRFEVDNVNKIIRAEANDNYTNFYLTNVKTYLASKKNKTF
jgi:DNA-binding LytR/AlgR family response regulator